MKAITCKVGKQTYVLNTVDECNCKQCIGYMRSELCSELCGKLASDYVGMPYHVWQAQPPKTKRKVSKCRK